jgi:hypothetical protein
MHIEKQSFSISAFWNRNRRDIIAGASILVIFLIAYNVNLDSEFITRAIRNGLIEINSYARLHVLTCLVPALFIAGAISYFVSSGSIIRILSGKAGKFLAYATASISGSILAVCSCTVLPLFGSLYMSGVGIGPSVAFLYSGPSINILAMIMTTQVIGPALGIARIVGSITLSVVIGILMQAIYHKEDKARVEAIVPTDGTKVPAYQSSIIIFSMIMVLLFATWQENASIQIYAIKWYAAFAFLLLTIIFSALWLRKSDVKGWLGSTWFSTKQIMPLLFMGVMIAGVLFSLLPRGVIEGLVGGNSIFSNLFASVSGVFMYFATITEIPIVHGLLNSGMGKGPALSLLLAGPALSLPSMLVIWSILGPKKSLTYFALVIGLSALAGFIFGLLF